jgi:hypothetical protein
VTDINQSHLGARAGLVAYSGWDSSNLSADHKRSPPSQTASLLPESPILWGLISQYIHTSASLAGFIDVHNLISEVEEVEQIRQGLDNGSFSGSLDLFEIKVAQILACASLAAVDLDQSKAQELGIGRINIDALVRDLWKKARSLITPADDDYCIPAANRSSMSGVARGSSLLMTDTQPDITQQTECPMANLSNIPLRIVAVKIVLLLAARSFATPSEYLKLHLDLISSAVESSVDSPCDDGSLMEQEWRWQLWSFLCVLDWTSPGVYHNGSYFIRPEMGRDPPSKVPGVPDDRVYPPSLIETDRWDRLSQTRYYLEYALALAHLSRRAEDCIIRPGPISPTKAAELCADLDALDSKLSFYQLLGSGTGRGDGGSYANSVSGSASGGGGATGGVRVPRSRCSSHPPTEHQISLQRAPQVQNMQLRLELGLIRFKLFRHEAFHLMHDPNTSGPLRMMCMDACMDACILVLSHCRNMDNGNLGADAMQGLVPDATNEDKSRMGPIRRVLQPVSSAALVGQVLLHASQSGDVLSLMLPDKHSPPSVPMSRGNSTTEFFSLAERSIEGYNQYGLPNGNGLGSWGGRLSREKVRVLQWHINSVLSLLETLQPTSSLARYKLALHRQCM